MIFFYLLVSGMPLVNQSLFARFVSDLTTVKYFGAASLVYAGLHLLMGGGWPRLLRGRMAVVFAIFYAWAAISHFTLSLPVPWQLNPFLSYTSFFFLFLIVVAVVDTQIRLRWTLLVAVGSVGLGSVYMVREWLEFHNVYKDFRPGFVVGDSNYYTLSALLCLPFAFVWLQDRRPWLERAFLAGTLLLAVIGVALGASRGGFLGLTAEACFLVWNARRRGLIVVALAAVVLPALLLAPISSINRLLHPDYSDVAAQDNRLVVWRAGLRMIEAHPFTGIGLGNFKPRVLGYEDDSGPRVQSLAHNTYIELTAELGVPGLAAFLALLVTAFAMAGKTRRRERERGGFLHQTALGLQAAMLGAAVAIVFLSAENQKLLWLMLALSPCLAALSERAAASAVPAPPTGPEPHLQRQGESQVAWARELSGLYR